MLMPGFQAVKTEGHFGDLFKGLGDILVSQRGCITDSQSLATILFAFWNNMTSKCSIF